MKDGDEEDVSETYDLGLLEGVVGVTLRELVVFDIEDSEVEGILGADGDISEEESRILEMGIQVVTDYLVFSFGD